MYVDGVALFIDSSPSELHFQDQVSSICNVQHTEPGKQLLAHDQLHALKPMTGAAMDVGVSGHGVETYSEALQLQYEQPQVSIPTLTNDYTIATQQYQFLDSLDSLDIGSLAKGALESFALIEPWYLVDRE